ncbi:MAG: dipeptide epimerase [Dehalococcoidia bacterium]|nr:dipeptide epimerase [Dehalococcoidia bacterium]
MELEHEPLDLPLAVPFTIARGSRAVAENVLVRLTWEAPDGRRLVGLGEAAPNAYYGENVATVRAALDAYAPLLGDDPLALEAILARLAHALGKNAAARAALDMALHDLAGQLAGLPLWRWWGLDRDAGPLTSFTIGIAEPDIVARRAKAAAESGFPLLKIKLGSGDLAQDRAILAAVREATGARLMVDANAAWSPKEAVQIGPDLVTAGVELLEQPVAATDLVGMAHVHAQVPLPLIADESCVVSEDVPRVAHACDGINIKLMKCGGLHPARRLIEVARAHGLQVMVGCMVESSLAITAATHLLPWLDYADLDGHLLLEADPFGGVTHERGRLTPPDRPGLGVIPRRA